MTSMALKFAASTLVIGVTGMGCVMTGIGTSPAFASERDDQQAAQLAQQASHALQQGHVAEGITLLEQAVALSPRDAGYRLTLGDTYVRAGRFRSAEAAYRDVLTIDPQRTRAALTLALMQVANGRSQQAMAQLERIEGNASPADLGLAYALAGSPQRAVDILEPAARSMSATPRVRQNLALAYALGGDWERSRTVAAQDVSPAELGERMTQWAALAQRSTPADQVASLLGVNPVTDPGQPARLALAAPEAAPATTAVALAAADSDGVEVPMPTDAPVSATIVAAAEAAAPAPAPVALASADPAPVPAPAPTVGNQSDAPAAVDYAQLDQPDWGIDDHGSVQLPEQPVEARDVPAPVRYAAAAETLVRPNPVVMPVHNRVARSMALASRAVTAVPRSTARSASGHYVVQIGAFSSAANAERAWQMAEHRFGLSDEQPVTMTIDMNGRLLHRVAISGFDKHSDAANVCASIKARGGECWVRGSQGDAVVRWATRYTRRG